MRERKMPETQVTASVRLAIFDCDGTLVDSQYAINACMESAFLSAGLKAPPIAEVRRVVGLPLLRAIQVLAGEHAEKAEGMAAAYSSAWQGMRSSADLHEPVFAGIEDVLDALRGGGWTLGVATGKSMRGLKATLQHHGLSGHFSTLQTADRARGKPDPEMLHLAMLETGAVPRETVMIGDTTFDMEMAQAAGVRGIGVAWGYHAPEELKRAGASVVVESAQELGRVMQNEEETAS